MCRFIGRTSQINTIYEHTVLKWENQHSMNNIFYRMDYLKGQLGIGKTRLLKEFGPIVHDKVEKYFEIHSHQDYPSSAVYIYTKYQNHTLQFNSVINIHGRFVTNSFASLNHLLKFMRDLLIGNPTTIYIGVDNLTNFNQIIDFESTIQSMIGEGIFVVPLLCFTSLSEEDAELLVLHNEMILEPLTYKEMMEWCSEDIELIPFRSIFEFQIAVIRTAGFPSLLEYFITLVKFYYQSLKTQQLQETREKLGGKLNSPAISVASNQPIITLVGEEMVDNEIIIETIKLASRSAYPNKTLSGSDNSKRMVFLCPSNLSIHPIISRNFVGEKSVISYLCTTPNYHGSYVFLRFMAYHPLNISSLTRIERDRVGNFHPLADFIKIDENCYESNSNSPTRRVTFVYQFHLDTIEQINKLYTKYGISNNNRKLAILTFSKLRNRIVLDDIPPNTFIFDHFSFPELFSPIIIPLMERLIEHNLV